MRVTTPLTKIGPWTKICPTNTYNSMSDETSPTRDKMSDEILAYRQSDVRRNFDPSTKRCQTKIWLVNKAMSD